MLVILAFCAAVFPFAMEADTPEEFLHKLSSGTASQWVECQSEDEDAINPDTVEAVIATMTSLSVEPGDRLLEDMEGGYRAVFPESRWTWCLPGGRIGSVTGTSVVEWRPAGYSWVTVPLFTERATTLGSKEQLCLGVTTMSAIGLVAIVAIWFAKRKYG